MSTARDGFRDMLTMIGIMLLVMTTEHIKGRDSYYKMMDAAKVFNCLASRVMGNYINGKVVSKYFQPNSTKILVSRKRH